MRIEIDPADLWPIIEAVVAETLGRMDADRSRLDGERLGFTEAEAAGLLGVPRHVLRDARLRGEIAARKIGKKFIYDREVLLRWLRCEHTNNKNGRRR